MDDDDYKDNLSITSHHHDNWHKNTDKSSICKMSTKWHSFATIKRKEQPKQLTEIDLTTTTTDISSLNAFDIKTYELKATFSLLEVGYLQSNAFNQWFLYFHI